VLFAKPSPSIICRRPPAEQSQITFREAEPVAILDKSGHLKGQTKGLISIPAHRPYRFSRGLSFRAAMPDSATAMKPLTDERI
jgi:hypothetical protein